MNLCAIELQDSAFQGICLGGLLRVGHRRIVVVKHWGGHQEVFGLRVVFLDALNKRDHAGCECGRVERWAYVQVAKVVSAEIDDNDIRCGLLGKGVAAVGVISAVARVELRHYGTSVNWSAGVVARHALATPSNNTIVCTEGFCCQGPISFWVVFHSGSVGARINTVQPVADTD